MTRRDLRNVAASIHQRLLNAARANSRPFDEVLQYFAMERFLYRLCQSAHAGAFVLKGALLFRIWDVPDTRSTRDIDLLGYLDNSPEHLAGIVREICAVQAPDDGLLFDPDSVGALRIKEDADYAGVRVRFRGRLGNARIAMQTDIGFGDAIHPRATLADYPSILDLPAPSMRTYPPETVIAEKLQTMVHLGALNSRMKDFYDVYRLSQQFDFRADELSGAISRTFATRSTEILPFDELRAELEQNENLERQWRAFLAKSGLHAPNRFADVLSSLREFAGPVFRVAEDGSKAVTRWNAPGPWEK